MQQNENRDKIKEIRVLLRQEVGRPLLSGRKDIFIDERIHSKSAIGEILFCLF